MIVNIEGEECIVCDDCLEGVRFYPEGREETLRLLRVGGWDISKEDEAEGHTCNLCLDADLDTVWILLGHSTQNAQS